jgi:hypothetical protein
VNNVPMARERGQKIAHALLERAQLRLDEDLSDERVGSQLDQFLSCGVELEEEEEEMQMKSLSEKRSSSSSRVKSCDRTRSSSGSISLLANQMEMQSSTQRRRQISRADG